MDHNRLWVIGATLLIGLAVVVGWVLGVSPQLELARAAKAERIAVEAQNALYEQQLDTLKADFAGLDMLQDKLDDLRLSVPDSAQVPRFVSEVSALAAQSGVVISQINVSDAVPYEPTVVVVPEAAASATPDAATTETAPTDAAATESVAPVVPVTPILPVAVAPVTNDLVTAANFVSVPVSLTLVGGYDNVLTVLHGLQTGDRLVSVGTVTTAPVEATDAPPAVTATVTGLIYVLLK